jgi:hypothetical protein
MARFYDTVTVFPGMVLSSKRQSFLRFDIEPLNIGGQSLTLSTAG